MPSEQGQDKIVMQNIIVTWDEHFTNDLILILFA